MWFFIKVFDLFMPCFGVYLLYAGWSGKGPLYRKENLKEGKKETYRLFIRWCCLIGGPLAIVTGVLDFAHIEPLNNILFTIFALMVLTAVIGSVKFSKGTAG